MAFVSRLTNWLLTIVLLAVFVSWALNHTPANANQNASAFQPGPSYPVGPLAAVHPSQFPSGLSDDMISQAIKEHPFNLLEGFAWCRTAMADDAGKKLVNDLYAAGADKVYVSGFTLYAQLPDDSVKHAACMKIVDDFRTAAGMPNDVDSRNHEYAVVDMLPERLSKMHH
jgi:hypothetical protein